MIREFDSWANRDVATGKMQVSKYSHPINDYSFNKYMLSKQFINWEWREWDNRQKWIPPDCLYESLCRHIEELKLLTYWYIVTETRRDWTVTTNVYGKWCTVTQEEWSILLFKDIIETLNAIRFNSEALKLYYLQTDAQYRKDIQWWDDTTPQYIMS